MGDSLFSRQSIKSASRRRGATGAQSLGIGTVDDALVTPNLYVRIYTNDVFVRKLCGEKMKIK